uniref:DNA repair protein SWI5 homolog n=1 Tax=Cyanistes caeruleus TaxID=156563 RepID=A0A8C0VTZ5_CYACU
VPAVVYANNGTPGPHTPGRARQGSEGWRRTKEDPIIGRISKWKPELLQDTFPFPILSEAEFLLHVFCVLQIPSPKSFQPNGASEEALRCEIEELKRKDLALDQEIAQLLSEGYSLEELDKHISLLHEYNEIKDAGQMLLGKLAVIRGVTTKQLYPEYDLELSD